MRTYLIMTTLGLTLLSAAMPAEARINQRQDRQQQRIARGITSGSLNAREAVRLERQQVRIARFEAESRRDGGGLNRHERRRIEHWQDRASYRIFREKRDRQVR